VQYQSSGSGADRDDVDSPAGASHCLHTFRSACLDKRVRLRHHRSGAARAHAGRQARRYGKCVGRRQDPGGAGVTHGGAGGGVNRGSGSTKSSAGAGGIVGLGGCGLGGIKLRTLSSGVSGPDRSGSSYDSSVGSRRSLWPRLHPRRRCCHVHHHHHHRSPPPPPAALHRPGACSAPALPCIRVPNCCCSRIQSGSPSSIFCLMHKRRMER